MVPLATRIAVTGFTAKWSSWRVNPFAIGSEEEGTQVPHLFSIPLRMKSIVGCFATAPSSGVGKRPDEREEPNL